MADGTRSRVDFVAVEKIDNSNREAAIRLQVAEEHLPYVAPVEEMLKRSDGTIEDYAIRAGEEVVGFFRLDFDRNRVAKYAGQGRHCGVRGYLIGREHQGKGYGRAAVPAIRRLMRGRHPGIDQLFLTVNCRNAVAISVYGEAGFRDTGAVYHGGDSGPQYVFALPLT